MHVNETRTEVNNAQEALYERKQEKMKEEKHDFEFVKNAQATAKLNLEAEPLVKLKIGKNLNNIVPCLLQIMLKHKELEKYNPSNLKNFRWTLKQRAGPFKHLVRLCTNVPDVFDLLAKRHLRGSEGLQSILNFQVCMKRMPLEWRSSLVNIDEFLQKMQVVQRLNIAHYATE